jgi:cytidylate kinase
MALILADFLNLKYIYAGGVLKEWAKKMGFDPTSDAFHDWEAKYGDDWDKFWEGYIAKKLAGEDGFLCEGKTAGFLLANGRAFEVMVTASEEVRAGRASKDGRTEQLHARDKFLSERWYRLFGIKLMDPAAIDENYDLRIDNSNLTISESVGLALTGLQTWCNVNEVAFPLNMEEALASVQQTETVFWERANNGGVGKDILKERLINKGLYMTNEAIFADWKENYQQEMEVLPAPMREAVVA